MDRKPTATGFTLVETLIVMALAAILLAVAIPSFRGVAARARAADASAALQAAFELARSEAIRRNTTVTVCRTLDANAVAPQCSASAGGGFAANDWASGWLVFVDSGAPPQGSIDPGETVVTRQMAIADGGMRGFVTSNSGGAGEFYVFQGDGLRAGAGPATLRFDIDYRATSEASPSEALRCLRVNLTGLASAYPASGGVC